MSSREAVQKEDIGNLVNAISDRGWQEAAVFLLEIGQPFALIGGQLLWILQPTLSLLFSGDVVGRAARFLEQPGAVSALIEGLDSLESSKTS